MATQTRKEHYDECKAKNLPLPEIVDKNTQVGVGQGGEPIMARPADYNDADFREVDDKGNAGPWQRAKS